VSTLRRRKLVRHRAGQRCEYCRLHENDLPLWPLHLDHIVAEQHAGTANLENLAWACQRCNLYKGTNLTGIDPDSAQVVPLFHPRHDRWEEHFALQHNRIVGRTPKGRATVWLLQMNCDQRLELRTELLAAGLWPP
jgi:hypothetical protein